MRRARSASGLPMSEAMTLNIVRAAGVKRRISRLASRNSIAISELFIVFRRSLAVARCMLDGLVELTVEGGELLVERLQLLLGGFQFLVGRLQLLVDRHRLFVGGGQLVIGCLEVVDCAFQLLAGGVELLLELGDMRRVAASTPSFPPFLCSGSSEKLTSRNPSPRHRLDRDGHRDGVAVTVHLRAPHRAPACSRPAWRIAARSFVRSPSRAIAKRSRLASPTATFR